MRLVVLATLVYVMASVQTTVHAADFLFVQTASGATLNGTLTMTGVAVHTSYFADRPVRVAGTMATEEFLALFEPSETFGEVRHILYLYVCCVQEDCVMHVLYECVTERIRFVIADTLTEMITCTCACVCMCACVCVCVCVCCLCMYLCSGPSEC